MFRGTRWTAPSAPPWRLCHFLRNARVYAALGDFDQALAWLDRAYEEHAVGLVHLKDDPGLDPLRRDLRFQDLLRRMNFPP